MYLGGFEFRLLANKVLNPVLARHKDAFLPWSAVCGASDLSIFSELR